ncbi:hypothetical protein [Streptomyces sp. NPDC096032]|uniref:hypothetical protein n=1 Tax=Streptomyces sp. NPDC096032 TaxID=3366070 RepID=UPI003819B31B
MFPVLDHVIAINPSPRQLAESLAVCLEAPFDGLYQILMDQLAENPDLFSIPGDDTGLVGFGEKWMHAMEDLTNSRQAANGDAYHDAGGRPSSHLAYRLRTGAVPRPGNLFPLPAVEERGRVGIWQQTRQASR